MRGESALQLHGLLDSAPLDGGQAVGYDFEGESSMDHPCNAWFNLVNGFQMNERFSNVFFFLLKSVWFDQINSF